MKKLGGFTCHSPAAIAVCIPSDPRSAIVPRRLARGNDVNSNVNGYRARLVSNVAMKYSKLVESSNDGMANVVKKPVRMLSSPSSSENVFNVVVMRVAIHCQGCASKVKRHLTKMEGQSKVFLFLF